MTIRIRVERDAYSPKPELWLCTGHHYLIVPGLLVTSIVKDHGITADRRDFYVKTASGSRYIFDWAPTLRQMNTRQLQEERLRIQQNKFKS